MTLPTDQRHVNVYVVHPDDVAAAGAIRRMKELAQGRAIDPFVGSSRPAADNPTPKLQEKSQRQRS